MYQLITVSINTCKNLKIVFFYTKYAALVYGQLVLLLTRTFSLVNSLFFATRTLVNSYFYFCQLVLFSLVNSYFLNFITICYVTLFNFLKCLKNTSQRIFRVTLKCEIKLISRNQVDFAKSTLNSEINLEYK